MIAALWARLQHWMNREGDTLSLAFVRIGSVAVLWSRWGGDLRLLAYREPERMVLATITLTASFFLAVGLFTRASAWITAIGSAWVLYKLGYVDGIDDFVHHHTQAMVIGLVILAMTPCGRSLSVDRWLALRRAEKAGTPPPPSTGPVWAVLLFSLHLAAIYLWGTQSKLTSLYLSGTSFEHQLSYIYTGSHGLPDPGLRNFLAVNAWVSVALEAFLAVAFLFRKWLVPALVVAVPFHAFIYATLPVATFTATMFVLYLAAMDPDDASALIRKLSS